MPEIQMPKLSDTMTEGTLVAWKKKKGEQVSTGEVLAEIETDKATMEWESPEDGVLTEIFVEEGGKVEVGQKIAFIGEKGEAAPARPSESRKPRRRNSRQAEPQQAAAKPNSLHLQKNSRLKLPRRSPNNSNARSDWISHQRKKRRRKPLRAPAQTVLASKPRRSHAGSRPSRGSIFRRSKEADRKAA